MIYALSPKFGTYSSFLLFNYPINKTVRNREKRVLESANTTSVSLDDKLIKVYWWGNGDKNALLIHGWESNAGGLGGFVEPLLKRGYQILSFDGPAHGKSEGWLTNIIEFSNVIKEIIELDQPDTIITHSFGSAALIYALHQNDHLKVKNLILVTSPNRFEDVLKGFTTLLNFDQKMEDDFMKYISKKFQKNISELEISNLIKKTSIERILLVHDIDDRVLSYKGAKKIAGNSKNVELFSVKNKGHYRILWDEDVIQTCMNFLMCEIPVESSQTSSLN